MDDRWKAPNHRVFLTFDDGMTTAITIKGKVEEFIHTQTGELSYVIMSGKENFLKCAESKTFIDLGNEARRYKDIKQAYFEEIKGDDECPKL